jgi:triosephosphate isomerase
MEKKKIIIANWKANPSTLDLAKKIILEQKKFWPKLKNTKVVICPPMAFLPVLSTNKSANVSWGAQDVSLNLEGSFTGENTVNMLKSAGAQYVILGHSERRKIGETAELVAQKVALALKAGLTPILCVGETIRDDQGDFWHNLKEQISISLSKVKRIQVAKIIVAYEPVWAIGKKESGAIDERDLHEATIFVRKCLSDLFGREMADKVAVLYGGSVSSKNASAFLKTGDVAGLLIGRGSLETSDFNKILMM